MDYNKIKRSFPNYTKYGLTDRLIEFKSNLDKFLFKNESLVESKNVFDKKDSLYDIMSSLNQNEISREEYGEIVRQYWHPLLNEISNLRNQQVSKSNRHLGSRLIIFIAPCLLFICSIHPEFKLTNNQISGLLYAIVISLCASLIVEDRIPTTKIILIIIVAFSTFLFFISLDVGRPNMILTLISSGASIIYVLTIITNKCNFVSWN